MSYIRRSILKYAMPPQAIQYMQNIDDLQEANDMAVYLLRVHFPWMPLSSPNRAYSDRNYIMLYKQAYLATMNNASPSYQTIYDTYIEPILMDKIGQYFWLNQRVDYLTLYQYIKRRPYLIHEMMEGNFNADITLEAVQLNADIDDGKYRGGDIEIDQEEVDLFPPIMTRVL